MSQSKNKELKNFLVCIILSLLVVSEGCLEQSSVAIPPLRKFDHVECLSTFGFSWII